MNDICSSLQTICDNLSGDDFVFHLNTNSTYSSFVRFIRDNDEYKRLVELLNGSGYRYSRGFVVGKIIDLLNRMRYLENETYASPEDAPMAVLFLALIDSREMSTASHFYKTVVDELAKSKISHKLYWVNRIFDEQGSQSVP